MANKNKDKKETSEPTEEVVREPVTSGSSKGRVGFLVSSLDHNTYISYNGETIVVAPRGRTANDIEENKLGSLPKKVRFVANS